MSTTKNRHPVHVFDIDFYLNPLIPGSCLHLLPRPISFWFGYRKPPLPGQTPSSQPASVLLVWLFSFLGAFIGIAIIENVFLALPDLGGQPVPIVIASFGAAAILEYNTIESPLSQPRNLIFGHFLSAVIGVAITKLFRLLPEGRFEELRWVAGALSVGAASTVMGITKTVHPPAGATALLAATSPEMTNLGWWVLPLVLLACSLMLASAMLVNNIYKRFPLYWWTPADLSKAKEKKKDVLSVRDIEKQAGKVKGTHLSGSGVSVPSSEDSLKKDVIANGQAPSVRTGSDVASFNHYEGENFNNVEKKRERKIHEIQESAVTIEGNAIVVPDWMTLSRWEVEVLEGFQTRLRQASR